MADINVILPQYGMGMQDAEVVKWLKAEGEPVSEGEPLVEVEAAKTTVEVVAPVSGILKTIIAEVGQTVEVREKLGVIST